MPNQYPSNYSGITSGITAFSATQDPRTINYDTYNWTPIQNLMNADVRLEDIPRIADGKGITMTILKQALFRNKLTRKYYLRGRDF